MGLTRRRRDFLERLIDIYNRTDKPVHYETLAQEVGVSKWTAYDMLQALEKTGFLSREYAVHNGGVGRSQIVFVPTENAYGIVGKRRTELALEESVDDAMDKFSRWVSKIHTKDVMEEMMAVIQAAPSQSEYCMYVLGLLIIVLLGTEEKTVHLIKHFVLQTPSEAMQLATFTGAVFGNAITSIHSEVSIQVVDLLGGFLKEVDALSTESEKVVAYFLIRALSSI